LAFALFLSTNPSAASENPTNKAEKTTPNNYMELTAGVISSDIGGGIKQGPAISLTSVKELSNSGFLLRLGLEYNRKSGAGHVGHTNMATGEVLYRGQADVNLHYFQTLVALGYDVTIGPFNIAPYFGVGPALLTNQTVKPAEPALEGAFENYRAYSSFEILALGGLTIRYSNLVFDIQLAEGLLDLENSYDDEMDGTSHNGTMLFHGNSRSRSIRFALGIQL